MTSAIDGTSGVWPLSSAQNSSASTARADVMTAVAKQLGVSTSQLQSELQSGQSLSQVAQAAGLSSDQLNTTVTTALQNANLPAGANISAIASRMENHVGGHHHHGGGGGGGGSEISALLSTLDSTASSAGTSDASSGSDSSSSEQTDSGLSASSLSALFNAQSGSTDTYA